MPENAMDRVGIGYCCFSHSHVWPDWSIDHYSSGDLHIVGVRRQPGGGNRELGDQTSWLRVYDNWSECSQYYRIVVVLL